MSDQSLNVPNGGFPPIYICDQTQKKKIKSAEFSNFPESVNIKTILERRKNIPFFPTSTTHDQDH